MGEEPGKGKYKGLKGPSAREGLGRLRRANSKDHTRITGWEQRHEDDDFVDRHGSQGRTSHSGEGLLARFNRLATHDAATRAAGSPGEIAGFSGSLVQVRDDASGAEVPCQVRQVLKKKISGVKSPLCVGDRVRWTRDGDQAEVRGVIEAVEPRRNQLARADSHNRSLVHVFAANIDRLVIVSALADPDFKPGLVDRYLLIAAANDLPATLVLNKTDLADAAAPMALYRSLGVPVFATAANAEAGAAAREIGALRDHLRGKVCVIAGQSGVGKSSLVNALHPTLLARVGAVAAEGFGRHTTTAARSYLLPDGGRLVDTPGIRECAIAGMTALDVALHYADIAPYHRACRFTDCTHLHEPGCAVREAVERGAIAATRYGSYHAIVTEDLAEKA